MLTFNPLPHCVSKIASTSTSLHERKKLLENNEQHNYRKHTGFFRVECYTSAQRSLLENRQDKKYNSTEWSSAALVHTAVAFRSLRNCCYLIINKYSIKSMQQPHTLMACPNCLRKFYTRHLVEYKLHFCHS